MTKFDLLPDEIIRLILGHVNDQDLYAYTLINKRFYAVSNPLLWRTLNMKTESHFISLITGLIQAPPLPHYSLGQHVRTLVINDAMKGSVFLLLLPHIPRLETLDLHNATHITDQSLQHLPRYCPNLKTMIIHKTNHITAPVFISVCQHLPQLGSLQLMSPCPELLSSSSSGVLSTLATCCRLEEMRMEEDEGTAWLTKVTIQDLTRFSSLKILTIKGASDTILQHVLTTTDPFGNITWPHLTRLDLGYRPALRDQVWIPFIQSHPALKDLTLNGSKYTDLTLDAIGASLPGIHYLKVFGNHHITTGAIRRLAQKCRRLYQITIFACVSLVDGFPEVLAVDDDNGMQDNTMVPFQKLDLAALKRIRHTGNNNKQWYG